MSDLQANVPIPKWLRQNPDSCPSTITSYGEMSKQVHKRILDLDASADLHTRRKVVKELEAIFKFARNTLLFDKTPSSNPLRTVNEPKEIQWLPQFLNFLKTNDIQPLLNLTPDELRVLYRHVFCRVLSIEDERITIEFMSRLGTKIVYMLNDLNPRTDDLRSTVKVGDYVVILHNPSNNSVQDFISLNPMLADTVRREFSSVIFYYKNLERK